MRTLLFTLISLACSLALAATVYKWVDENGVVHYSDQPHPNAQKVQLKAAQTYKDSSPASAFAPAAAPGTKAGSSVLGTPLPAPLSPSRRHARHSRGRT